ncbi:MAG TPA: MFS transporter, partial [Sulfurimonas sp.]|nr:MFS transporter [Sulfurimonas sp.]
AILFFTGAVGQFTLWIWGLTEGVTPFLLFTTGILSGTIRAGDQTTRTVLSKDLFSPDDYGDLNRCLEVARQFITFLAGGLGGLLLAYGNFTSILLLDCLSYLVGGLLILKLKTTQTFTQKKTTIWDGPKAVFSFLSQNKAFTTFSFLTMIPFILVVVQNVLYPIHFKAFLGLEGGAFAFLSIPYGAGAISSAWLGPKLKKSLGETFMILVLFMAYTFATLLIGICQNVGVTYGCLFLFACCHSCIRIERMTLLMKKVPNEMAGRITGFFDLIALLFNIILTFLIGHITDTYSLVHSWLFLGLIMLVSTLSLSLKRSHRPIPLPQ